MGVTSSKLPNQLGPDPRLPFSAAGILFSNTTHVLAGYQPYKIKPCITGIGGSKLEGETALETAWRETIEELFDCKKVPSKFIIVCQIKLTPMRWIIRNEYICFHYTFDDLKRVLHFAKQYKIPTRVYSSYPTTLLELLMNRDHCMASEIKTLCLLPFTYNEERTLNIHEDLCLDVISHARLEAGMSLVPTYAPAGSYTHTDTYISPHPTQHVPHITAPTTSHDHSSGSATLATSCAMTALSYALK